MKTIKFYTLGCKVNQYDTQSIRESFIQTGFKELEDSQPADIYIINTCTVTHRADSNSLNLIRRAIRQNPRAKVIVTGCLAQLDEDISRIKQIEGLKAVIAKNKDKIVDSLTHKRANWQTRKLAGSISYFSGHTRAFLKIQDGCNNFCSYCKVPYVRGASRSKPMEEIVNEGLQLVENGFKEIVLCGICLGAYGKELKPKISLADILGALEKIEGLLRIRLSSIEAADISDALIDKIAESKKFCRHLHIPLQSGDDEILKDMNRKYCRLDYLNLIRKIKSRIPEIAITTDVLVGFPTETEENFQNTVQLIQEILPLKVHIFPYSLRQGTEAAAKLNQDGSPKIIKERQNLLEKVALDCSLKYKSQFLNRSVPVLVEAQSKFKKGFWQGYTDNYIRILFRANLKLKNELVIVKLKKLIGDYILGDISG